MTPTSPRSRLLLAGAVSASALALLAAAAVPSAAAPRPDDGWDVRLLGEHVVAPGQSVDGMPIGELSGLDYDRRRDRWYLIADDTEVAPARFFSADIEVDRSGLRDVEFTDATALLRRDGTPFPSLSSPDDEVADPESIRVAPLTGTLYWSSEGRRLLPEEGEGGEALLTDPWVRQATVDGRYVRQFGLPSVLEMTDRAWGPRTNAVFEGLSFSADGRQVVTSMEGPLHQDGPEAAPGVETATRLTWFDALTGWPVRQAAYPVDPISGNGVVELLAVDRHRYLVLERSYSPETGNSIRLYEVDVPGATDVLRRDSLADGRPYRPVDKRLVVDFADLGLAKVDNIEGMGWGPRLGRGERALVFVSDDNLNPTQITQVVALAVRGGRR